jgi:hypothetical protein
MTIAAGMRCSDGIVICADTENTDGNFKRQKNKIWGTRERLLVTGAGAVSYLKMAADKLSARIEGRQPDNSEAARSIVERLMRRIHEQHILPLHYSGHPNANDVAFSLIIAIRCGDGQLALIKTELTTAVLVNDYEAVGTGADIFNYWARYFLDEATVNMDVASYFSLFMLREAKDVARNVGGSTFIFKMDSNPLAPKVWRSIWDDKAVLAGFPQSAVKVLLSATNLRNNEKAFEWDLDMFKVAVRQLRGALQNNEQMAVNAAQAFREMERKATEFSSANEPEPPPERSDGAAQE